MGSRINAAKERIEQALQAQRERIEVRELDAKLAGDDN